MCNCIYLKINSDNIYKQRRKISSAHINLNQTNLQNLLKIRHYTNPDTQVLKTLLCFVEFINRHNVPLKKLQYFYPFNFICTVFSAISWSLKAV